MQNIKNSNIFFIDEINNLAKCDTDLLINMGESMYNSQISELVKNILEKETIKIIFLAGPSSSGKTTTSKLIAKELKKYNKNSIFVSLDDFFLDREKTPKLSNGNYDFESINALDLKTFNSFINDLLTTNTAQMPRFNFITDKREKTLEKIIVDKNTIIIIEGLHALNPNLIKNHVKEIYKIYICAHSCFKLNDKILIDGTQIRLMRRLIRDYYSRGRQIQDTFNSWDEVLNGEKIYIEPYKNRADYLVDSTHMYEPLLYAKYLMPLLNYNSKKSKEFKEILKHFEILDKSYIPKNSLLNEFIAF